jgi:hypothetical protein
MKIWKLYLTLALGLVAIEGFAKGKNADALDRGLAFTVHVTNYAKMAPEKLATAETVASEIFTQAGVRIVWVDSGTAPQGLAGQTSGALLNIWLNILPSTMANRLGRFDDMMGLAPGAGPDRRVVYAFYDVIDAFARTESMASKNPLPPALILGHVIAHEIGHLLLNLETHSSTGIMRGDWNRRVLKDAKGGLLVFTSQQAEVIRSEVIRRTG